MTGENATSQIRTVAEYVQKIIDVSNGRKAGYGHLWYRGIARRELELVPGTIWRSIDDEDSLVEEFRVNLPAYSPKEYTDPWDVYCLMQHHGLPTRMLDWSKSPLAALFFALDFPEESADINQTPAVWILNPYALNKLSHGREALFVPKRDYSPHGFNWTVQSYLPGSMLPDHESASDMPACPIAIEPPFSNTRLTAQQGCFTIHGSDATPLDRIPGMSDHLEKLEIYPEATGDAARAGAAWISGRMDLSGSRSVEPAHRARTSTFCAASFCAARCLAAGSFESDG